MLTYTLSTREKALVLVLALVLVAVAWFMLVYQRTAEEAASLDAQIAETQGEIEIISARAERIDAMKKAIEQRREEGVRAVEVPSYDNMAPLMEELNRVLAATDTYSISFDEIADDGSGGYVQRGVKVDFGCGSYDVAKAIVNSLANGPYPCAIDTVSVADGSVATGSRPSSSSGAPVSTSLHLTYLEKR